MPFQVSLDVEQEGKSNAFFFFAPFEYTVISNLEYIVKKKKALWTKQLTRALYSRRDIECPFTS